MTDNTLKLLSAHRFFAVMKPEYLQLLASCAHHKTYKAQEMLGQEGDPSDCFFAILEGRIAIEIYQPGSGPTVVQTLHGGEIVGWSWLFPPYKWVFDARALDPVQVLAFDGICLRAKCQQDTALGFELMTRFAQIITLRLKGTRLQLLDIYGRKKPGQTSFVKAQ